MTRRPPAVTASSRSRLSALCSAGVVLIGGAAWGEVGRPSVTSATMAPYAQVIAEASARFGIPATWIAAVMRAESGGQARAVSPKGALGLMQIMPRTWATLRPRYGLGADPFDPGDNIVAGAAYLRELYDRFGSPGFLAAYNAGPGRYAVALATGRPLPEETRGYVAKLTSTSAAGAAWSAATLRVRVVSWRVSALFPGRDAAFVGAEADATPHRTGRGESVRRGDLAALEPHSTSLFVATSGAGAGL